MSNITLDYDPRDPFIPFHHNPLQFAILVCHRRAGKTVSCVAHLILRALTIDPTLKNPEFAYIGPYRQQAKKVAWQYLKDMTEGLRRGAPRESDLMVTLHNGANITIYGADNPDAFRGQYFDGCVIDEFGDQRASLWNQVIIPALMDRQGWAVVIGTVKGKNHFHKMWLAAQEDPEWFAMMLKASESGILSDKVMTTMRKTMGDTAFNQEMECDWDAAVPGTYYAEIIGQLEQSKRIGNYSYNPELPVFASADLGYSDSTAWWFWQVDEGGPIFIDYEEASGKPLAYYFEMLDAKPWKCDTIWLPHDAVATSLQTGRSTIEQFLAKKYPVRIVTRQKVQHGIDAARMLMPYCRFSATHCFEGIEALRAYRRQYNDKTDTYAEKPLHDWSSNGADAFRYAALVSDQSYQEPEPEIDMAPAGYTLNELWEERENSNWREHIIRI